MSNLCSSLLRALYCPRATTDVYTPPRGSQTFTFLFFALLIFVYPAAAQITVTNATFPVAGDKLRMRIDYNPVGITITPPGFNYNWNLSHLQTDALQVTEYKPASQGSQATNVPDASLFAVVDGNTEVYYAVTANRFQRVAQYGVVPATPGLVKLTRWLPPIPERRAPLNFFDIYQSGSYLTDPQKPLAPAIRSVPQNYKLAGLSL